MDTLSLSATKRAPAERAKLLRKAGELPGVIYGSKTASTPIKMKLKDFHSVYMKAGESTLVEVELDGVKIPSLIHSLSFEPVTGAYEHIDLYAVDMAKKVTTHVPLVFKGESPAVKDFGGVLVTVHDKVTVTCLPKDLPHSFEIDLSSLVAFRNSILVSVLKAPAGVIIEEKPDSVLVTVQEPRAEEIIAPTPVEGAAAIAETVEEAVPAEGAAVVPAEERGAPEEKGAKEKGGKEKKEKK